MCPVSNFEPENKAVRSWLVIAFALVISIVSVALLIYLLQDLDLAFLRQAGFVFLGLVLVLSILSTATYTLAVYALVRASGYQTTVGQAYLVLTASLSANYVTPVKVGIPLRIYLYNHFMGIPAGVGTALVAVETLVGMFTPALLAVVGVIFLFPGIPFYLPTGLLLLLVVLAAAAIFIPVKDVAVWLEHLPWSHFTQRAIQFLGQVQAGMRRVPISTVLLLMVLFALNFAINAARLYLVLFALGYPVSILNLFFVLTISVTAGNISMLPMGLGIRDATFTWMLVQLGLPNQIALSAALIQRIFSPGWPLLLGLISANILGVGELLNQRHTEHSPEK